MVHLKILLVEDSSSWQKILNNYIRRAVQNMADVDCDIKLIETFHEAYVAIEENSWDLLVTDLGLGDDDIQRQKLGKKIVELAYTKTIPAIVVSGTDYLIPMDIRDLLTRLGASDFFYKQTFDSQEFINKVQEVLQIQQQSKQLNLSVNGEYILSAEDRQYLVKTLSRLATNGLIDTRSYFKNLIQELNLSEDGENNFTDVWTGDANRNAEGLIKWCEQKKRYPKDDSKSLAYTVLGCLVVKLLEETGDNYLLEICIKNQLITDEIILENLKNKYI